MEQVFGDPGYFNEDFDQTIAEYQHEIGNLRQKVLFGQSMIQKLWYKLKEAETEIKRLRGMH